MNIPDFLKKGSESFMLRRISFRRQSKDDEETQLGLFDATLDLVLDLKDHLVDKCPAYLVGAKDAVRRAKDGHGTSHVDHIPLDSRRTIRLSVDRGASWTVFTDAGAEVRLLEVVATADSARFRAKVRVSGLSSAQCGQLLECDSRPVEADFEPVQVDLPLQNSQS